MKKKKEIERGYTLIVNGEPQKLNLYQDRPFAELLSREQLEAVERGDLVGVNFRGDVLALSSPLPEGSTVTLREPCLEDLSTLGIPDENGHLVSLVKEIKKDLDKREKVKNHGII